MIRVIFAKVRRLKTLPYSGEIVPEIGDGRLRQILAGNYRILYTVEEGGTLVRIAAVVHAARLLAEEILDE